MVNNTALLENPLKSYTTYRTYFIIKVGKLYSSGTTKSGYEKATLLIDTRGQALGENENEHPQLTVNSFEVEHIFNGMDAKVSIGLDGTLVIFERGGASYLHKLGLMMRELGISNTGSLVLWVGVGVIGWTDDGGSLTTDKISEKWFPFNIKDIEMEMRNSGSEYTHWLIGTTYSRANNIIYEQMNIKETIGSTMQEHLDDLMRSANIEANRAIESNNIGEANNIQSKKIKYSYVVESDVNMSSPVEVNTTAYDTGGKKHLSSGGKNGTTTVMSHINNILKHTPRFLDDLKKKEQQYKIVTKTKNISDSEEEIAYIIKPYDVTIEKTKKPLLRLNYFFGGRNEDIIDFGFKLDGTFHLIPQSYVNNTSESIRADADRAVAQNTKNVDISKTPTTADSIYAGDTKQTDKTPQNHSEAGGITTVPKHRKSGFGNDMNRSSSEIWNSYNKLIQSKIGIQLVESSVTIRGNPHLILDDATIDELGLENAVNYIVFNIGTPLPTFQDAQAPSDAPIETFIYSGSYMIRRIKSVFGSGGSFRQELQLGYLPEDVSSFGVGG